MNSIEDLKRTMRQAGPPKWLESLLPSLEQSRAELAERDARDVAWRSACVYDEAAHCVQLRFWGQLYTLDTPAWIARDASGGDSPPDRQAFLLMYLKLADGSPVEGRWLTFRQLPGGMFYANAFNGYAERRLARTFAGDLAALARAARALGGERLEMGSAAFAFAPLPRVHLAAVYWLGDEDLPHNAGILFDAAASHYLSLDALAVLGSQLTGRLIRAYQDAALEQAETLTGMPLRK